MRSRADLARLAAGPATVTTVAVALWLAYGPSFANYDSFYGLVWGAEIADAEKPDFEVSLAPTPKPLGNLAGLVLSVLGDDAERALVLLAFVALGLLGWVVYRLGAEWFGPAAGALAAVIVLTREPILSFGVRAYVDIPYLVLVLAALLAETRRRRAGTPVLLLLGLAGLVRPEAWLFSAAYLGYLARGRPRAEVARHAAIVLAAPAIWALMDLYATGNPLHSLTGTRETAVLLGRRTGLDDVPLTAPRRVGEILREPVLFGGVGGLALTWLYLRRRARLPLVAGGMAAAAFCTLAAAGLPILGRYLLLGSTILAIFCGAGVFGWLELGHRSPARTSWQVFGAIAVVLLIAFTPAQVRRLDRLEAAIGEQAEIRDDLHELADDGALGSDGDPVAVPNHRAVPLLALWLDREPDEIVSAQLERPSRGYFVTPATQRIAEAFVLDPRDPRRLDARVPLGFRLVRQNRSWVVWAH